MTATLPDSWTCSLCQGPLNQQPAVALNHTVDLSRPLQATHGGEQCAYTVHESCLASSQGDAELDSDGATFPAGCNCGRGRVDGGAPLDLSVLYPPTADSDSDSDDERQA